MVMTRDLQHVVLVDTKRGDKISRGFTGGTVELNELDIDACVREVHEEIGIDLSGQQLLLVGGYNKRAARTYGVWPESKDEPLQINDHFSVFVAFAPLDVQFKRQESEIETVAWYRVEGILSGTVEGVHRSNVDILRAFIDNPASSMECRRVKDDKVVF